MMLLIKKKKKGEIIFIHSLRLHEMDFQIFILSMLLHQALEIKIYEILVSRLIVRASNRKRLSRMMMH